MPMFKRARTHAQTRAHPRRSASCRLPAPLGLGRPVVGRRGLPTNSLPPLHRASFSPLLPWRPGTQHRACLALQRFRYAPSCRALPARRLSARNFCAGSSSVFSLSPLSSRNVAHTYKGDTKTGASQRITWAPNKQRVSPSAHATLGLMEPSRYTYISTASNEAATRHAISVF